MGLLNNPSLPVKITTPSVRAAIEVINRIVEAESLQSISLSGKLGTASPDILRHRSSFHILAPKALHASIVASVSSQYRGELILDPLLHKEEVIIAL